MEKPSPPSDSPTSSEKKEFTGGATRRPIDPATGSSASDVVTVPSRQAIAGKLFKKCKSATFQIDGATYTIGEFHTRSYVQLVEWRTVRRLHTADCLEHVAVTPPWTVCKVVTVISSLHRDNMTMIACRDVSPCSAVKVDRRFRIAYCLLHRPDDGGSTHVWNVGLLQRENTTLHHRRLSSAYSPPWEHEVSHVIAQILCLKDFGFSPYRWN
jgi:hypothetical protein